MCGVGAVPQDAAVHGETAEDPDVDRAVATPVPLVVFRAAVAQPVALVEAARCRGALTEIVRNRSHRLVTPT